MEEDYLKIDSVIEDSESDEAILADIKDYLTIKGGPVADYLSLLFSLTYPSIIHNYDSIQDTRRKAKAILAILKRIEVRREEEEEEERILNFLIK